MKPHESLHHLDIKDVGPEISTESFYRFDPKREITEVDWENFRHQAEILRTNKAWLMLATVMDNLSVLNPDRARGILKPGDWEGMLSVFDSFRHSGNAQEGAQISSLISHMTRIDPQIANGLASERDWDMIDTSLNEYYYDGSIPSYIEVLLSAESIRPRPRKTLIQDADWKLMTEELDSLRSPDRKEDWKKFALLAGGMAEYHGKFTLPSISSAEWTSMMTEFQALRHGNLFTFMEMASSLTRLSRELGTSSLFSEPEPKMPTTRKF